MFQRFQAGEGGEHARVSDIAVSHNDPSEAFDTKVVYCTLHGWIEATTPPHDLSSVGKRKLGDCDVIAHHPAREVLSCGQNSRGELLHEFGSLIQIQRIDQPFLGRIERFQRYKNGGRLPVACHLVTLLGIFGAVGQDGICLIIALPIKKMQNFE